MKRSDNGGYEMNPGRFYFSVLLSLAAMIMVGGCSSNGDSASALIGPDGGTVSLKDGTTLIVPQGALSSDQTITVASANINVDAYSPVSKTYRFQPAGLTFSIPVTVTIPYDYRLGVIFDAYWSLVSDEMSFEKISGTFSETAATVQVSHFSYGFVGTETLPVDGGTGDAGEDGGGGSDAGADAGVIDGGGGDAGQDAGVVTFIITATAGANGSITPSGEVQVNQGTNKTFEIAVTTEGYHIDDVVVDSVSQGAISTYTFTNVTAAHTISATFAINTYIITATAGGEGTITPSGLIPVIHGEDSTFDIAVTTPGYHIDDVVVDGETQGPIDTYTFDDVASDHDISASFAINVYTLTYTAGTGGTITGTSPQYVPYGGDGTAVTAIAVANYHFVDWDDDSTDNPRTDADVTADISVTANFAADPTYSIGGSLKGLLGTSVTLKETNSGNTMVLSSNTNFALSGFHNGDLYNLVVWVPPATPAQACTVTNGSGAISGGNVTNIQVVCHNVRFAYMANYGSNSIGVYSVDITSGQLLQNLNYNVSTHNSPSSIAISPTGRFLYATNQQSADISAYAVNPSNGMLNLKGYFQSPTAPGDIAIDSTGRFAYVTTTGAGDLVGLVTTYAIDNVDGGLTTVETVDAGQLPLSVNVDPAGKFAYVTNMDSNDISVYSVDPATGALSQIGSVATTAPLGLMRAEFDPTGRFIYMASSYGNTGIYGYNFNSLDGGISQMTDSPFSLPGDLRSIAIEPTGRFIYVANATDSKVYNFDLDPVTGSLSAISNNITVPALPVCIAVDPSGDGVYVASSYTKNEITTYGINPMDGGLSKAGGADGGTNPSSIAIGTTVAKYVYVANYGSNDISIFSMNAGSGALTPVADAGTGTQKPNSFILDPTGRFGYAATGDNVDGGITSYEVDPSTGLLIPTSTVSAGINSKSAAVGMGGRFLYVANYDSDNISEYGINPADGHPVQLAGSPVPAGDGPKSIAVHPTGKFVYVVNNNSANVSVFQIEPTGGQLLAGADVAAGTGPTSIAVHPTGRAAYVTRSGDSGQVRTYRIDTSSGALSALGDAPTAEAPYSIAVHPTGRFAYIANYGSSDIMRYDVNPTDGTLIAVAGTIPVGTNPVSITIEPTGRFAYVANETSKDVSMCVIDQSTGALTCPIAPVAAGTTPASIVTSQY